jgi:hypothetical protein
LSHPSRHPPAQPQPCNKRLNRFGLFCRILRFTNVSVIRMPNKYSKLGAQHLFPYSLDILFAFISFGCWVVVMMTGVQKCWSLNQCFRYTRTRTQSPFVIHNSQSHSHLYNQFSDSTCSHQSTIDANIDLHSHSLTSVTRNYSYQRTEQRVR